MARDGQVAVWRLDHRKLTLELAYGSVSGLRGVILCRLLPRAVVIAAGVYGSLVALLTPRQAPSSTVEALLRASLIIFAIIGASFLAVSTASLLLHGFDGEVARGRRVDGVTIVFSVVSRGDNPALLRRCLSSLRYWVRRLEPVYGFRGLIELVCDADPGPEIRGLADRFVVVPECYRTRRGSLFKARALQYSVEARVRDGLVGENTWIYHIDDDTIIGEDTITGIVEFIAEHGRRGRLLGIGELLPANNIVLGLPGIIGSIADLHRNIVTLVVYSFILRHGGKPLLGMIGNNYLVNSVAEARIGYDCGPRLSMGEDSWFALRFYSIYGGRAAWMPARAYEEPVHSIKDLIKQRRRWYYAALVNSLWGPGSPRLRGLFIFATVLWSLAPLGLVPPALLLLITGGLPAEPLAAAVGCAALGIAGGLYMLSAWRVVSVHPWRPLREKVALIASSLLLLPVVILLECVSVVYTWLRPPKVFERTEKVVPGGGPAGI